MFISYTVGSKILLHPNATSKVSLSYDNLRLGGTDYNKVFFTLKK